MKYEMKNIQKLKIVDEKSDIKTCSLATYRVYSLHLW